MDILSYVPYSRNVPHSANATAELPATTSNCHLSQIIHVFSFPCLLNFSNLQIKDYLRELFVVKDDSAYVPNFSNDFSIEYS